MECLAGASPSREQEARVKLLGAGLEHPVIAAPLRTVGASNMSFKELEFYGKSGVSHGGI